MASLYTYKRTGVKIMRYIEIKKIGRILGPNIPRLAATV
jgi:hypothetical protein